MDNDIEFLPLAYTDEERAAPYGFDIVPMLADCWLARTI
jgi:hypothetical protein